MTMSDKLKTVREALEAADRIPELNPSNYNHDDVMDLNDHAIDASTKAMDALAALSSMEAEAGEVVGLSEWDACALLRYQRETISHLLRNRSDAKGPFDKTLCHGLRFQDGVVRDTVVDQWTGPELNILSYEEFLARMCVTFNLEHPYAHPKAQEEVELTEAEVERMGEEYRERLNGTSVQKIAHNMVAAYNNGIRHLASKYRLIPRKP